MKNWNLVAGHCIPLRVLEPRFRHGQERVSKTLADVSKCDRVWTRSRLEKPTLTQHEIIDVAVVVLGRELAREIANLFKIRAKTLWVGHVANSKRYHASARATASPNSLAGAVVSGPLMHFPQSPTFQIAFHPLDLVDG